MLTIQHDDYGACDSFKVNSVHCEHISDDVSRVNITVNTTGGDLEFYIGSDANATVDQVAPRIASSVEKDITLYLDKDRHYLYAIDNSLSDDDHSKQIKITGGLGHYTK